ncbi:MAG: nitroreductase [Chloroflexi bacterium HGW-Chloroflexi-1]|nr:MAG: nitroreductase [Chloroflexi bacterium HGW-Chloroflexi-1]
MKFTELIRARYSVRAYKPDPVPDELLQQALEAARLAPTAANRQPWRIVVIPTAGREEALRRIYDRAWFVQAPLVVCVCTVPEEAWTRRNYDGKSYADVDAAIVMDHLILAATDAGLGACWIAAFDPAAAREVLDLPAGVEPVLFTPLGYPADTPGPKRRKPLADLYRVLPD